MSLHKSTAVQFLLIYLSEVKNIIKNRDAVAGNKQNKSTCENISTDGFKFPGTALCTEVITSAKAHPSSKIRYQCICFYSYAHFLARAYSLSKFQMVSLLLINKIYNYGN